MKKIFVICVGLSLSACGFHLRGLQSDSYKFPFKTAYLECVSPVICSNLTSAIKSEALTTLVNSPESADAIIKVYNEQTSRDPLDYNRYGRIASYLLTYQVTVEVFDKKHIQIGNDMLVKSAVTMNYNDSLILSSQQQEVASWEDAHSQAVNGVIRRIVYLDERQ